VLGRNGCGKSTLLRLLGKIYKPSAGSITYLNNIRPRLLAPGVGFIDELSGMENLYLSYSLMSGSLPSKEIVDVIVEYSEIKDRIYDPVSVFSSGMRARLAFSTAIHTSSSVILIDEALGAGDDNFRAKVNETYKSMISEGKSFVIVSHNINWVKNNASRVIVLEDGKICFEGAVSDGIEKFSEVLSS
tara:strand:- start:2947 stop:3510 length:564 start_codon:yes stop_codon:yes gene_type:complete